MSMNINLSISILIRSINSKRLELFARVQLGSSHSTDHRLRKFHDCLDPIPGFFGQGIEATTHFILHCPDYHCARDVVFEKIMSIDSNISQQVKVPLTKYLLFGANMLNSDKIKSLLVPERLRF